MPPNTPFPRNDGNLSTGIELVGQNKFIDTITGGAVVLLRALASA